MNLRNGMMNLEVRDRHGVICTFGVWHGIGILGYLVCSIVSHINDTITNVSNNIPDDLFDLCNSHDVDFISYASTKTFLGYTLCPAIQLNATIDAINPTKLKNLKSAL